MTPSGQFILHITTAGERWDLLAWRYYGDPTDYSPIIMANPNVAIEPVFDAGIVDSGAAPAEEFAWSRPTCRPGKFLKR